jgi:hypothetical protein
MIYCQYQDGIHHHGEVRLAVLGEDILLVAHQQGSLRAPSSILVGPRALFAELQGERQGLRG